MRFSTRNTYYLRISANAILPLYLYLDEKHVDWMNERVFQHVLEDLRLKIPEKLASEPDSHHGPLSSSGAKKGSMDVHRGETYQFGYLLRRTDPHAVLIKTRNFVAAPLTTARNALSAQGPASKQTKQRKRPAPKQRSRKRKADVASPPVNKKRRRTKGKGKARATEDDDEEEEEIIDISSDDEDGDDIEMIEDLPSNPGGPVRRSARKRAQPQGSYIEIDDEDEVQELPGDPDADAPVPNGSSSIPTTNQAQDTENPAFDDTGLIMMDNTAPHEHDMTIIIKSEEQPEESFLHASTPPATIPRDADMPPSPGERTPTPPPRIDLGGDEDEEEQKPKPILKLSYEGFNVNGKCLCVIVEPYPPLPAVRRQVSLAPMGVRAPRAPSIAPADFVPSGGAAQRARTPLFLPGYDDERDRSETPAPFAGSRRNLPPIPLFLDDPEDNEDDDDELGGGMFALSQVLQTVGNNTALLAEDEDEMDGAVFFGDADEAREL